MPRTDPIHVYVDGSYNPKTHRLAYGWVVENAAPSMTQARVVISDLPSSSRASTQMEARAFLDAVSEFACYRRPIVIHGDCTALANVINRYRLGEIQTHDFFDLKWLPEAYAHLLVSCWEGFLVHD